MLIDIPGELRGVDFALIHFQLEFQETYGISREVLMSLRRDLLQAARLILPRNAFSTDAVDRFSALFDPPLPVDPVALRRHQRPSAPFAILPEADLAGEHEAGDLIHLKVAFWGGGIRSLGDFARTLRALGRIGLHRGEGQFELAAIVAEDVAGNRSRIWREGEDLGDLAPPLCNARWWLESDTIDGDAVDLEFVTPARLLSRRKPLFRPTFDKLFPFVLRRVTAMMHAHCGLEFSMEPHSLLAAAARVETRVNRLCWKDWKTLAGEESIQDLGGVCGRIRLEGDALAEVYWALSLGTLLNVGKNASFGAGHYRLRQVRREALGGTREEG
jgi:hypothetical protein